MSDAPETEKKSKVDVFDFDAEEDELAPPTPGCGVLGRVSKEEDVCALI